MVFLKKYQNRKIAIYGMGLSGFSAARKLKKAKAEILCWDDNQNIRKKIKNYNFVVDKFWAKKNKDLIDYIVISPGIDINKSKIRNYLKKNLKKIITDIDIFFELNRNELIISITGTNGKSTTCKIIEKILKSAGFNAKAGGNLGKPALSLKKSKKKNIFILEISSYQLQYSKLFRSKHAAILNISPDHLDRHGSIKKYIQVKSKIFFAQKNQDHSYINLQNKYSKEIFDIYKAKKLKSKLIKINTTTYRSLLNKINNGHFKGKGNIENLVFAYQITKNLGVSEKIIVEALNKFKGLPHRQEIVFSNKGLTCINDSKATSFDACLQSLKAFNNIYWIVGGLPKQEDVYDLRDISHKITKKTQAERVGVLKK